MIAVYSIFVTDLVATLGPARLQGTCRGRTAAVIAGLLFMGGLRRAEVSALEWRDVSDASASAGSRLSGDRDTRL